MALADNASTAAARFAALPVTRQISVLVALAATIAIGFGVVLWSRDPSYLPLFNQISQRDTADVIDVLQKSGIDFKLDQAHGTVMVPSDVIQTARLKLAAEGLPRSNNSAVDMLGSSSPFSSSQFMENARYKQALETELARTISQFHDIKAARVHLAIPRESAFVRDDRKPSASVFLDVYRGVELKKHSIAAIVNLVASSIPSLSASRVTVVDQNGQLLNEGGGNNLMSDTDRYMDYRNALEHRYTRKIQDLLTPVLGYGRVKAKVSADLDFTRYEQTQESYNPEQAVVRSEQSMIERKEVGEGGAGVPGALANRPPANGQLNQRNNTQQASNAETSEASAMRQQSTKNFELDKTISHMSNQPGSIKRLTVAVLVDDKPIYNEKDKKVEYKPLTEEEIEQVRQLVTDAIGLNVQRGDSLKVINTHFVRPEPVEPLPPEHFWQKDWFWSIVKQVLAAILILLILFGLLRPMFKSLSGQEEEKRRAASLPDAEPQSGIAMNLPPPSDYEGQLSLLRQIVDKEPKRVAQVVKSWVDRG